MFLLLFGFCLFCFVLLFVAVDWYAGCVRCYLCCCGGLVWLGLLLLVEGYGLCSCRKVFLWIGRPGRCGSVFCGCIGGGSYMRGMEGLVVSFWVLRRSGKVCRKVFTLSLFQCATNVGGRNIKHNGNKSND